MDEEQDEQRGQKRKAEEDVASSGPRRIRALDQDVVNKIAAGEIIVAPVHALKELLENAVDAGSTLVEVSVKEGGLKLLQITDNGHGINRDDLTILCERFTTSKLKTFDDLRSIATYGFRGEALASISHIAHLTVTTKTTDSSCAWRAHYGGGILIPAKPGQKADPKPTAGRQGTQITVEDLFYNVPNRRRAFRSASEEYSKTLELVSRYAIHCIGVAFSCKKQGGASLSISVPANATIVDRIRQIHGSSVANELIEVQSSSERYGFKATSWVSSVNYSSKRVVFILFINHRAVGSSAIKKAVEHTYATFLPKGGHPFIYISLEIEPHRLDVNIHPTKREVNFLDEDEIIELVCSSISMRLGKVDSSRAFLTQTLLPGAKVPSISHPYDSTPVPLRVNDSDEVNTPGTADGKSRAYPSVATPLATTQRLYENNLVRTDSRARKITAMLPASSEGGAFPAGDALAKTVSVVEEIAYTTSSREPIACRLTSIHDLRAAVNEAYHPELSDSLSTHTFIGIVDMSKRIAAVQTGVRLLLVDYGMLANELFYQIGLAEFGNFGSICFEPPLSLKDLLRLGAEAEKVRANTEHREQETGQESEKLDWDEVISAVYNHLVQWREMLNEYYSLDISDDGHLRAIPLLLKGYIPSLAKLPTFLLRLGPHVDWTNESACFDNFLTELASYYVPEQLPDAPLASASASSAAQSNPVDGGGSTDNNTATRTFESDNLVANEDAAGQNGSVADQPGMAVRRHQLQRAIEHIFFPEFKSRLVATNGLLAGVIEVANLRGLYRVFERC